MGLTTENKLGSNCSGTDGQTGRILTLANTGLTTSPFQVFKNGVLLTITTDYTVTNNITASTITFVSAMLDAATILVNYQQNTAPNYCTYQDVYDLTGLSTTEIGSSVVTTLILYAEAELEELTNKKWTSANAVTEVINAPKKDIIGLTTSNNDSPNTGYGTTINLNHYPVQSITNFDQVDVNGSVVSNYALLTSVQIAAGTWNTTDYWLDAMVDPITQLIVPYGKITLKSDVFANGRNSIVVSYTYGYTSVPTVIKNLAVVLAGMRTWVAFLGGQYNRINSYSIPQQSVTKGDLYARGKQQIEVLQAEADRLLNRVGIKPRTLFYASSDAR